MSFFGSGVMPLGKFAKITLSWGAITVLGISLFVLAKNDITSKRIDNMRARERMRRSNQGEYPEVYRSAASRG